jgi:ribonuclease HI
MELSAALCALEKYGKLFPPITVYCDSAYTINTLTNWMFTWEKKGWIKSDKKTPENLKIIKKYFNLLKEGYQINLVKVKGHNNVYGNEIADRLATGLIDIEWLNKKIEENNEVK